MRAKPVELKLDPVDNQRLARVCGSLDENGLVARQSRNTLPLPVG